MPRFDAKVEVICDDCGAVEFWEPEYVYTDYSGSHGHYDTSDAAFTRWADRHNWIEIGDNTFCGGCAI